MNKIWIFYLMNKSRAYIFIDVRSPFNPILHGLLEIRYYMGGDQNDPPLLKSIKMVQTW